MKWIFLTLITFFFCIVQCSVDVLCILLYNLDSHFGYYSDKFFLYPIHGLRTFIQIFLSLPEYFFSSSISLNRNVHVQAIESMSTYFLESAIEWNWLDVLKNPKQWNGIEIDYFRMHDAMTQIRQYFDWYDAKEREWRRSSSGKIRKIKCDSMWMALSR